MSGLNDLYQQIILDHNRAPKNFRSMEDATSSVEGYNPLCGDHYTVYLRMAGDKIDDVSFTGAGCAISKASASVMSSLVKGKTRQEVQAIFGEFQLLVTGKLDPGSNIERLGKLGAFAGVSEFPARVKCAILAWHTLRAALDGKNQAVSTE